MCWRKGTACPLVLIYPFASIPLEGLHFPFCEVWTLLCCKLRGACQAVFICLWMTIHLVALWMVYFGIEFIF